MQAALCHFTQLACVSVAVIPFGENKGAGFPLTSRTTRQAKRLQRMSALVEQMFSNNRELDSVWF